jgi:hypothetical protein
MFKKKRFKQKDQKLLLCFESFWLQIDLRLLFDFWITDSREKAYIHAVSAAGVAYSITRACSKGEITECGCDDSVRSKDTKGKWEWGGCSDDIKYGAEFSKDFVDSVESIDSPQGLMNLHNNEAGRRVSPIKPIYYWKKVIFW